MSKVNLFSHYTAINIKSLNYSFVWLLYIFFQQNISKLYFIREGLSVAIGSRLLESYALYIFWLLITRNSCQYF